MASFSKNVSRAVLPLSLAVIAVACVVESADEPHPGAGAQADTSAPSGTAPQCNADGGSAAVPSPILNPYLSGALYSTGSIWGGYPGGGYLGGYPGGYFGDYAPGYLGGYAGYGSSYLGGYPGGYLGGYPGGYLGGYPGGYLGGYPGGYLGGYPGGYLGGGYYGNPSLYVPPPPAVADGGC